MAVGLLTSYGAGELQLRAKGVIILNTIVFILLSLRMDIIHSVHVSLLRASTGFRVTSRSILTPSKKKNISEHSLQYALTRGENRHSPQILRRRKARDESLSERSTR